LVWKKIQTSLVLIGYVENWNSCKERLYEKDGLSPIQGLVQAFGKWNFASGGQLHQSKN